jgi:hypothetical protein
MIPRWLAGALLLAGTFAVAGCGPEYDHTEITGVVGSASYGLTANNGRIEVMYGSIVKAHVVVWNDDKDPMSLTIRSKDPSKVEVVSVISDHDYAFIGRGVGTTEVELVADDHVVLTIAANVTPEPAP